MKVIYWATGFWPQIGGIETFSLHFIEKMQARGHDFHVIANRAFASSPPDEIYRGIRINRFDFGPILYNDLKQLPKLEKYFFGVRDRFNPDLIHLNTIWGGSALAFLFFRRLFNVPVLLTVHDYCLSEGKPYPIASHILGMADRVVCVTDSVRQYIDKSYPSCGAKSTYIHNGLQWPEQDRVPLSFAPPTILCIGRLVSDKGFHVAIRALARLRNEMPVPRLLIAGSGPEEKYLMDLARSLSLENSVDFIGEVAVEDVPRLMNRASIVVMPSLLEPFGLVAIEAGQMGRPVIASGNAGLAEVIVDNETGLLVPPEDEPALCAALKRLLTDHEFTRRLGENACRHVMKKFSIDRLADDYEREYQDLTGRYQHNECSRERGNSRI